MPDDAYGRAPSSGNHLKGEFWFGRHIYPRIFLIFPSNDPWLLNAFRVSRGTEIGVLAVNCPGGISKHRNILTYQAHPLGNFAKNVK